ncbi:MAG: alcohol dehydrogenase catalytic domain-containing protein [Actinomycetales bacterium]|nr:alcohol dehydrogenase catalytic domain-containing protein [Actinomycetales bacterium]
MRTVRAMGRRDLRLVEVPDPVPGPGEVTVAVLASGICGSDAWFWDVAEPTDTVAGHEVAGVVVALGPGTSRLRRGDRVAVNNVRGCGTCTSCLEGDFVRCADGIVHMGHGFSELVAVPERNCLPLADGIGFEAGCLLFDTWGTPFAALEKAGAAAGDTIAVLGCGPIGLAAVSLATLRGARAIGVDPLAVRRDAARRAGAVAAVDPGADAAARLLDLTGGAGVDVALECSAQAAAYHLALAALRIGGTLVTLGEGAVVELRPSEALIPRQLRILGSLYTSMPQGARVQQLVSGRHVDALAFTTHRFSLAELPSTFGAVVEHRDGVLKALVLP